MQRLLGVLACVACWGAIAPLRAQSPSPCAAENSCSFKKPNILLVLDYSSSMTGFVGAPAWFPPGQMSTTRWDAELDAASWILRYDQGFFADNAHIALTRFAHDPDPAHPGTTIRTDQSFPPITDGFAIDVPFDATQSGAYLECTGSGLEAAVEVLRKTPPPPGGGANGFDPKAIMLTWTRGALASAHALIDRTRKAHAQDPGESARDYELVLMTDGDWTCPDNPSQGCKEDPAPEAARLRADGVPVHVIAFGDATMTPSLNEVALQGGTEKSIDASSPQGIVDAFSSVLDRIRDGVVVPSCTAKLPRVLVIMDASTSMLQGSAPGATKWDKARFALSGNPAAPNPGDPGYVEPVLAHKLSLGGEQVAIEDLIHLGMVAFAKADQQQLMVNFGPCMRDNFAWAMDPNTSCVAPGCKDPYGGPPLTWTFKDSDTDRMPPFVRTTHSYMPACNAPPGAMTCSGTVENTYTGQGLAFAHQVIRDYKSNPGRFAVDADTRFVNILITDGETSPGSSSVQDALTSMVAENIATYVIGFGAANEIDRAQLDQYAMWGDTQHAIVVDPTQANGASALADALAGVVSSIGLSACCVLNDCEAQPEPPDPNPVCGDGKVEGDEVCDDGPLNATYGHCAGNCDGLHLHCGDKRVDGPEQCDDGNHVSGDGCDAHCLLEPDASVASEADGGEEQRPPSRVGGVPPGFAAAQAGAPARAVMRGVRDAGPEVMAGSKAAHGGCGCAVAGGGMGRTGWVWVVGLGLAFEVRRRRRRS